MGSWTNWWPQNRQGLHLEELCYQLLVLLVWELFCSATILGIEIFSHEIFTLLSMCLTTAIMKALLPIFKFLLSFPIRSYSCFCVSIDHLLLLSSAATAFPFLQWTEFVLWCRVVNGALEYIAKDLGFAADPILQGIWWHTFTNFQNTWVNWICFSEKGGWDLVEISDLGCVREDFFLDFVFIFAVLKYVLCLP